MAKWYKFKQYYLIRHLATGGMAEIFLSKQIGLEGFEKLLVIKKILKQYAENPDFVSMFLDEAKLAAKLDHPNVIRIYDFGKEKKSYYIAMEYIAGEDLRTILRKVSREKKVIPIQHSLQIISSICEGLDYAHKKKDPFGKSLNIIHRDISPQNIMISYEGNVKILDFGIAKASTQTQETEAGVLKGKYAYMSPEQAKGKKLDHRSDIFAVGILLYEMLTSKRLFKAKNQLDTLRKLVYEDIPKPDLRPKYNIQDFEIHKKTILENLKKEGLFSSPELEKIVVDALNNKKIAPFIAKPTDTDADKKNNKKLLEQELLKINSLYDDNIRTLLENIVMKALDKDVDTRYQTAREFQNDIEEFLAKNQLIASTTRTGRYMHEVFKNEIQKLQVLELRISEEQKDIVNLEIQDISQESGLYQQSGDSFVMNQSLSEHTNSGTGSYPLPGTGVGMNSTASGSYRTNASNSYVSGMIPENNNNKKMIFIIIALLLALAVGAFLFFNQNKEKNKEKMVTGSLQIKSEPNGASIILNGEKYKESTPAIINNLKLDDAISIKISKQGYKDQIKSVVLNSKKLKEISFKLEKSTAKVAIINISSKPASAVIYLDNKKIDKKTPATLEEIEIGEHSILIELAGYESYFNKFTLEKDEFKKIKVELFKVGAVKNAYISLDNISNAEVKINGERVELPIKNFKVKANQNIDIVVTKNGYETYKITKILKVDEKLSLSLNLKKAKKTFVRRKAKMGIINISTIDGSIIYLDGKKIGITNASKKVKAGIHKVKIINSKKMINYSTSVRVKGNSKTTKNIKIGKGKLAVSVQPWANVYINGRKIAQTPFPPKVLYAGRYTVKLVNPKFKTIIKVITIKAGDTKLIMEKFK